MPPDRELDSLREKRKKELLAQNIKKELSLKNQEWHRQPGVLQSLQKRSHTRMSRPRQPLRSLHRPFVT